MTNRQRLAALLGPNSATCSPQRTYPARLVSDARQQKARQTSQRYGKLLDLVQTGLREIAKLDPASIQRVLRVLTDWLGQNELSDFIRSVERGQLFQQLSQISPTIAQWLAENAGSITGAGRGGRRRGNVTFSVGPRAGSPSFSLAGLLPVASRIYNAYSSSVSFSPTFAPEISAPAPNPVGYPDTVIVEPTPSNVLEIPQVDGGDGLPE